MDINELSTKNDSNAQKEHDRENKAAAMKEAKEGGNSTIIDKRLDGPNRPST
jgi:hypothetical protein